MQGKLFEDESWLFDLQIISDDYMIVHPKGMELELGELLFQEIKGLNGKTQKRWHAYMKRHVGSASTKEQAARLIMIEAMKEIGTDADIGFTTGSNGIND